jgi:hypothetical protein
MSIKKTQLKITIEQKQTWRVMSIDPPTDFSDDWQTDVSNALKPVERVEISPRRGWHQDWNLKVLFACARMIEFAFRFANRNKD